MKTLAPTRKSNRRLSLRRRPRSYVRVECRSGCYGLGPNLAATVLDISDTGIRLVVKRAIEYPGEVEIIIVGVGVQKPIKRVGKVRWQVPLENGQVCLGVEFEKRLAYRDWQNLASPNG